MEFVANLLAEATINANILIHLGIKESFVISSHRYTTLGTYCSTGTTATAVLLICNIYHFLMAIIRNPLFKKNKRSFFVNPIKNALKPTESVQEATTVINLIQPISICEWTSIGRSMRQRSLQELVGIYCARIVWLKVWYFYVIRPFGKFEQ